MVYQKQCCHRPAFSNGEVSKVEEIEEYVKREVKGTGVLWGF